MAKAKRGKDFSEILVRRKIIGETQLNEALKTCQRSGERLEDVLVSAGYASQEEVMQALAEQYSLEYVNLNEIEIPPNVIDLMPESVARENVVLPLNQDNGALKIIVSDPLDFETVDKLRFILDRDIELALAPREAIQETINRVYGGKQTDTESVDSMLQEFTDTQIEFNYADAGAAQGATPGMGVDEGDAPIIRLTNLIITEAVTSRASDIHIEPFEDRVRVRYRIDGVLMERDSPPRRLLSALLSRLKIMGNMDITEKRRPQDGRIKVHVAGKDIDLRVSILPTNHGQGVVMRILDRESIKVAIRDVGFSDVDLKKYMQLIKRPNGIMLVTGPTGSGKTTTLYSSLNELNRPDVKIITAEDPVEYYLPGVNQVEVKHKIGLDFARIVRAMLRQNPNIILVGEIRDKETGEIAIQASLTGHLVFSTLHTNDAPGGITRMIDMGVQPFLVASSVIAILAQRLVRKICPKCKAPYTPDPAQLQMLGLKPERLAGKANFMKGKGCGNCNKTGYRGRMGIFEFMVLDNVLRELTFKRESTQVIRRHARKRGMHTLLEDGIIKAVKGLTTIDEILSITHHDVISV